MADVMNRYRSYIVPGNKMDCTVDFVGGFRESDWYNSFAAKVSWGNYDKTAYQPHCTVNFVTEYFSGRMVEP